MGRSKGDPAKQGRGNGGMIPPVERRFGQPNGNPRHNGAWKKEDTARYKLEQMFKLTEAELSVVKENPDAPLFERKLAKSIIKGDWKTVESMINQVYGLPKQPIEKTEIEPPKPLSPRKKNANN